MAAPERPGGLREGVVRTHPCGDHSQVALGLLWSPSRRSSPCRASYATAGMPEASAGMGTGVADTPPLPLDEEPDPGAAPRRVSHTAPRTSRSARLIPGAPRMRRRTDCAEW